MDDKVQELQILATKLESTCSSNARRITEAEKKIEEVRDLVTAIRELAVETKHMREDLNSTITRLTKLEDRETDKRELAVEIKHMREDLNYVIVRVGNIEGKETAKWEKFKWLIVASIVTVVIGFIAVTLKLK